MNRDWFTIKHMEKNIWALAEFGHFEEVISYLIVGDNEALLFDTGMGIGDIKKEIKQITSLPLTIVNSHCHFDHIGGNYQFETIKIFDSKFSKSKANQGYSCKEMIEVADQKSFFKKPPIGFDRTNYKIKLFQYDGLLQDGEILNIDPFRFVVIHTPGHSPDSICLYEASSEFLFSGDTLYEGPIYLQMEESSLEDYKKSIDKLVSLPIKTIYAAHNNYTFPVKEIKLIQGSLKGTLQKETRITDQIKLLLKSDDI